jgi:hypothetical protein
VDPMLAVGFRTCARRTVLRQPIIRTFMKSSILLSQGNSADTPGNSHYVDRVNNVLRRYPLESAGTLIGLEISSISGCIAALKLLGRWFTEFAWLSLWVLSSDIVFALVAQVCNRHPS